MMTAIKCIIFDLGRTLVPFSLEPLQARVEDCRPQARRLFEQAEIGQLPRARFQAEMCALTGLMPEAFAPWWNSIFGPGWLIPPAWIGELKSQCRLGLLSNTNDVHFDFLAGERPLLAEFDFHVLSHEVGAAKPAEAIYAAAEGQAACEPGAILYFDDVPEFVAAARQRGWNAETFTAAGDVEAAMARHGLARLTPWPADQAAPDPRASAAGSRVKVRPSPPDS